MPGLAYPFVFPGDAVTARDIDQHFWRLAGAAWIELRATSRSTHAYKLHHHPQLSVGLITQGQTCTECGGQEYVLDPGDMILIPAQQAHRCNPLAGLPRSYYMLYLDNDWCLTQLGSPSGMQLLCGQTVVRDAKLASLFMSVVSLIQEGKTGALFESARDLLLSLPGLRVISPEKTDYCDRLQTRLHAELQMSPSLDILAQDFSLRKETLIRHFRQSTGLTPGAWLNNARIEFAKAQLRTGSDIADAGYNSGFADQSHFHRTFVSFTASTPRQYARGRSISDNK